MKAKKIALVAIRVKDARKATEFFADLFETEFSELGRFEEIDVASYIDPLGIEIVEPLAPDGPTARAIEKKGEGLALLSLEVPNLEDAVAEMKSRGIRMVTKVEDSRSWAALFHPADTYGVMIELMEYKKQ